MGRFLIFFFRGGELIKFLKFFFSTRVGQGQGLGRVGSQIKNDKWGEKNKLEWKIGQMVRRTKARSNIRKKPDSLLSSPALGTNFLFQFP